MKFMLDQIEYKSKPTDPWSINSRIHNHAVDLTIEQLADEVMKGKTFVPALLKQGARSQANWISQQIICLDFDNEIIVDGNKIKQITMTEEKAIEEFQHEAAFIYTSFNHSRDHPKLRVVLVLDTVIDDKELMDNILKYFKLKYPSADEKCFERSRMFYGGRSIIWSDFNNKIILDRLLDNLPSIVKSTPNKSKGVLSPQYFSKGVIRGTKPSIHSSDDKYNKSIHNNNISLIINQFEYMDRVLNSNPITFNSRNEVYDYLKRQDLHTYLGIENKHFCCVFHEESKPSANIYINPDTGYWHYKCHSSSCGFTGTIIQVTERLTKLTNYKSLQFLMNAYRISLEKTEWQEQQESLIWSNLNILNDPEYIKNTYPAFFSMMRTDNYYNLLKEFHYIALENLSSMNQEGDALFYASMEYILKRLYPFHDFDNFKYFKKKDSLTRTNLFTYLNVLEKLPLDKLPDAYREKAEEEAKRKGFKNTIGFYTIPSYDANSLPETERLAKQFKELHMTVKNFDREMCLKTLGEEEANRVFPTRKGEEVAKVNVETARLLEETALMIIEAKGWVTEEEIFEYTVLDIDIEYTIKKNNKAIKDDHVLSEEEKKTWANNFKKKRWKKMLGGFLIAYGLERVRLNKKLKTDLNITYEDDGIPDNAFPFIIKKEEQKNISAIAVAEI
ncbi:hypothetical protein [Ammoniphilus resinae]|uniref:Zinc finger CHC2-type domain-containing protein n=1 Tax=Ammoniphilus resinae TaxID=861532 RepID=A0ABS4GXM3_9BACL|nr:hypothetical protein [Ammoniphilus resinae]MBP1935029.1 hypothetical protein [Ammoniphilus resinae]